MPSTSPAPSQRGSFDPGSVQCVGIIPAMHKRRVAASVRSVAQWLSHRGTRVLVPADRASALSLPDLAADIDELARAADLFLAMGGDGTFLAASRVAAPHGKPVLGINLGGFGFLASIPRAGMLDSLADLMDGQLHIEERMMLDARVVRDGHPGESFVALNDIVVGKGAFSRLLRLEMSISGDPVSDFPVDGMIVATPTGSTGYSLSAGGPVVAPDVRALIVTPICSHALSARTLIVPRDRVVELSLPDPHGEEVKLTADGQEGVALAGGDRIEVREAAFSARLIRSETASFYAKLRGKFGWMGRR